MKSNVNYWRFSSWFEKHRPNNFSRVGIRSLFDYLEQYEEDCGVEIEFDPIALCCEYTEFENMKEFHENYDQEKYPTKDELRDYTQVIDVGTDGLIIQDF